MDSVTVVFVNGNIVNFLAEEFNVGLDGSSGSVIKKFAYKDAQGQDSAIYLKPREIAGIFLTKTAPGESIPVSYKVGGGSTSQE